MTVTAPVCRSTLLCWAENPSPETLLIHWKSTSPCVTPRLNTRLGHDIRPGNLCTKPFSPPSCTSSVSMLSDKPESDLKTPICTPSTSSRKRLASWASPPSGATSGILADRLPGLGVQRRDGPHHAHPIRVLEIEQLVERPVQVIGEVGDLLPDGLSRIA